MWYLAGAYGVVWLLVFLFVFTLLGRQRQTEAKIEALERWSEARSAADDDIELGRETTVRGR